MACKGHNKEVDGENGVVDRKRGVLDDARAWHLLAIGHHGSEARLGLDGEARPRCCCFGDEIVGAACVEQGDEWS